MDKKTIMFIKPALETDAVWDPVRTSSYLGIWYLASLLKEKGHNVRYLDEVVRDDGLNKKELFNRTIEGDNITDTPLDMSYEEFEDQKMRDFHTLSPHEFTQKYTAFREGDKISRTMVRTGNPLEETLAEIERTKPDFVGIPLIASSNYLSVVNLGKAIKERFPAITLVFGGQHITAENDKFLKDNPWVDHLVTGDAINVIEGLVNGEIKERVVRGGLIEMKDFPLLDPSLLDETGYPSEPTYSYTSSGRKTADFMFTKGCFRNCEFCQAGSQDPQNRHVSAIPYEKLDEQLKRFKEHGIEELIIQDDDFLCRRLDKEHLPRVLGLMKKYGLYWQNNGGVEFEMLSDEVTDLIISYNKEGEGKCTALYIPFNPREWNKEGSASGTMTGKYQKCFNNLKRLREEGGIYIFTSEIIGTPEHTVEIMEEDIERHKEMIQDGHLDAALTLSATLLPGTKWNRDNSEMIVNRNDYPGYSLFTTHHKTENIPDPRIIEEYMVRRARELNEVQRTFGWGTAFPNAEYQNGEIRDLRHEFSTEGSQSEGLNPENPNPGRI